MPEQKAEHSAQQQRRDHLIAMGLDEQACDAYPAIAAGASAPLEPRVRDALTRRHLLTDAGAPIPLRLATAAWASTERSRLMVLESAAEQLQDEPSERRHRSFVEVLSGLEQVSDAFDRVQRSAQQRIRSFDRPPYLSQGPIKMSSTQPDIMSRGIDYLTIYLSINLHGPTVREAIQQAVDMGEQARLYDDLPVRMMIADDDLGLVILPQPGTTPLGGEVQVDALLVYPSSLLAALIRMFESTWARALPIDLSDQLGEHVAGDSVDRRILTLMSSGLTDARIAKALGVSERTVARRISRLQERLGAPSRFLLGVRAAQDRLL